MLCISLHKKFPAQASPVLAERGSTGESPVDSEMEILRQQLQAMRLANEEKDVENRNLHAQLAAAHEQLQVAQQAAASDAHMEAALEEEVTEGSLRKRLQRLCERKKNGCLVYIMFPKPCSQDILYRFFFTL